MKADDTLCEGERLPERIVAASEGDIGFRRAQSLADLFKMFGDQTRVRLLRALECSGEMCVCDLSEFLGVTKSAVSHQLALLRASKLVKFRRDGKSVIYSLDDEHVKAILELGLIHIDE